jgi:hypothetical protein
MVISGRDKSLVFKDYGEYFHHTKTLTPYQKNNLFENLNTKLRSVLEKSYIEDGWIDLVDANLLEQKVEMIKNKFDKDLYEIRIKINKGSKIRVKDVFWNFVKQELSEISDLRKEPLIGGIKCSHDPKDRKWIILEKR